VSFPPMLALLASLLAACGERAELPTSASVGPNPNLPAPRKNLFPTLSIAAAKGWAPGEAPTPASDLRVSEYAGGLDHPRWVYVLPSGDVLVAETNAPPQPELMSGIRGAISRMVMGRAGAGTPSANRITLLRAVDANGVASFRSVFLEGLNSPFGMALVGRDFYVADTDALLRFPYEEGQTRITALGVKITDVPAGPIIATGLRACLWAATVRGSTSASDRTATPASAASRRRRGAPRFGTSTRELDSIGSSPRVCAIPWAWIGSPILALSGLRCAGLRAGRAHRFTRSGLLAPRRNASAILEGRLYRSTWIMEPSPSERL